MPKKTDQFYFYVPKKAATEINRSPTHPWTLLTRIKQFSQSILGRFGFRLIRLDDRARPVYGLDFFFFSLKQFGFNPKHIINVGANHGNWNRTALKYFPDAQCTLIEPKDRLKLYISDLLDRGYRIRWFSVGAGDKPGNFPFTISHRDDSSSFAWTAEQPAGLEQITVEVKTLNRDRIIRRHLPT